VRVIARISSRSTGASSGSCWFRSHAMTRCQPSPNGTMNAKPSPTPLTWRGEAGGVLSRTSASITRPGKGSPSAWRTPDWTPSAPTTYAARNTRPPMSSTSTPWASCRRPVTSTPVRSSAPRDVARAASTRSVSYCGVMSTYGNRLGRRDRSNSTKPKRRSVAARCPVAISSSATPRASRSSSVRAWTANARVSSDCSVRRSTMVTATPAAARSPASSRPVGPAPTIRTSMDMDPPVPVGSTVVGQQLLTPVHMALSGMSTGVGLQSLT
jgi:hypothetical protein